MTTSARRFSIVFNSASGHEDTDAAVALIETRLREAGATFTLWRRDQQGSLDACIGAAAAEARADGRALVAVGGDGTLNAVAQVAWEADLPFAALPQGTFNYFAREHGISTELGAALDALLVADEMPVAVGMMGARLFLVNASVGLYPDLLEERELAKRRFGRYRIVAFIAGLYTLLSHGRSLELNLTMGDGRTCAIRARTLFVGNNILQLTELGLPEAQVLSEGGALAAIVLEPGSTWQLLKLIARGIAGSMRGAEGLRVFTFEQLEVDVRCGRKRLKVARDGETGYLKTPLVFRSTPRPLRLLVALTPPAADTGNSA